MKPEDNHSPRAPSARKKSERASAARASWQDWLGEIDNEEMYSDREQWILHGLGFTEDEWMMEVGCAPVRVQARGEPLDFFAPKNGKWPPFLLSFSLDHLLFGHRSERNWAGLASSRALLGAVADMCSAQTARATPAGAAGGANAQNGVEKNGGFLFGEARAAVSPASSMRRESSREQARGLAALGRLRAPRGAQGGQGDAEGVLAAADAPKALGLWAAKRASPTMAILAVDELSERLAACARKKLAALGFVDGFPEPAGVSKPAQGAWPHRSLWMPFSGRAFDASALAAQGIQETQVADLWMRACQEAAAEVLGPLALWASFDRQRGVGNEGWVAQSAAALFGDPALKKEQKILARAAKAGAQAGAPPQSGLSGKGQPAPKRKAGRL